MKTDALDRYLDFIRNWADLTNEGYYELLSKGEAYGESHIEPLRRELIENLINLDHQQQTNVIAFYIYELNRTSISADFEFDDKHEVNEGNGKWSRSVRLHPKDGIIHPFRSNIHLLQVLLLMEIESICKVYHIQLDKILADQNIDPNTLFVEIPKKVDKQQAAPSLPEFKPHFLDEYVPQIFDILKDFFSGTDQAVLLELLQSGGTANEPLLFIDNGSRLADAFKQLFDCGIINGCQKKELEEWIVTNFRYRYRENIKTFTKRYIADIISTNKDKCQRPLLNVRQDKSNGRYLIAKL